MKKQALGFAMAMVLGIGGTSMAAGVGAPPPLTLDPDTVEPGDEFVVTSDTPCDGELVTGAMDFPVSGWNATPDDAGEWSKTLSVPETNGADMSGPLPTEPGEYGVSATCHFVCPETFESSCRTQEVAINSVEPAQVESFDYAPATLTVVAPAEPEPVPPAPPAPTPVAVAPTFTG